MRMQHVVAAVIMVTVVQFLVWNSISKASRSRGTSPTVGTKLMDRFRRYPDEPDPPVQAQALEPLLEHGLAPPGSSADPLDHSSSHGNTSVGSDHAIGTSEEAGHLAAPSALPNDQLGSPEEQNAKGGPLPQAPEQLSEHPAVVARGPGPEPLRVDGPLEAAPGAPAGRAREPQPPEASGAGDSEDAGGHNGTERRAVMAQRRAVGLLQPEVPVPRSEVGAVGLESGAAAAGEAPALSLQQQPKPPAAVGPGASAAPAGGASAAVQGVQQSEAVGGALGVPLHPTGAEGALAAAEATRRVAERLVGAMAPRVLGSAGAGAGAGAAKEAGAAEETGAAPAAGGAHVSGLEARCAALGDARGAESVRLGCACVLERSRLRALHCFLARAPELAPAASARIGALAGGPGVRALAHAREILSYGSRVPGEAGWNRTLAHIEGVFARLGGGWALERDCFTAQTPLGARPMCNLVASFRPEAGPCLLDLAAHFESKFFADAEFPAATDSAAPVGMLLELAEALSGALAAAADAPCLRLLFLDGEEAFVAWSESDSLYGARHLAAAWEAAPDPHRPGRRRLESMTTLVLLDLLGYRHPRLTWHFAETRPLFARLQGAESRLRAAGLLDSSAERNPQAPPPPPSLPTVAPTRVPTVHSLPPSLRATLRRT